MKKKMFKNLLALGTIGLCFVFGEQVKAEVIDLQGYDAHITTNGNQNVVKTKKGTWVLDEDTQLYSAKSQKLYLGNTTPATIDSIYMQGSLELRGSGELLANTKQGQFGVNVLGNLNAFTCTSYGAGKVSATGNQDGIRVYGNLKLYSGTLEGYGQEAGIWSNGSTYVYKNGTLIGKADDTNAEGIGVWSNKEITACKNSSIHGTGQASGVYMNGKGCNYIYSDINSKITGTKMGKLEEGLSAIHSNGKLKACSKGELVEEYVYNRDLSWRRNKPVAITDYQPIKKNMNNFKNYNWFVEGDGTVSVANEGLLLDGLKNSTLVGTRNSSCTKGEPTKLLCGGIHTVKILGVILSSY